MKDLMTKTLTLQGVLRYSKDNAYLEAVNYLLTAQEEGVEIDVSIKDVDTSAKAYEVVKELNALGIHYITSNTDNYIDKEGKPLFNGAYFTLVRELLLLQSKVKTFTDPMDWELRGKILKFFGYIDISRELTEELVDEEYNLHHEIHSGKLVKGKFNETQFAYKGPIKKTSDSMITAFRRGLSRDNVRLVDKVESSNKGRYYVYNIRRSSVNIYVPAERGGAIRVNGNTLIRRNYVDNGSIRDILSNIFNRSVRSVQRLANAYSLGDDYFANRIQNTIFSVLYKQQVIRGKKYNAYSLIEDSNNVANNLEVLIELHKVYFAESVWSNEPERFTSINSIDEKGLYHFRDFPLRNKWTSWTHSDYVTTKGDNVVRRFTEDKVPLMYYLMGEELTLLNTNGGRTAMGTNMISRAMPIYKDGVAVPFDKRLDEVHELPEEWKAVNVHRGYYFWTVDVKHEDTSGYIGHEGGRVFNKSLIDMGVKYGDKFDTGLGDKGTAWFGDDPLYAITDDGKRLDLSIFVHHDTPGRDNPASTIAGLKAAEKVLGNNILEVFTERDGEVISLGKQAIAYTYFYLTDHVRGTHADYRETVHIENYERKTEVDKVRIGQEMITKMSQLGMYNTLANIFGGPKKWKETLDYIDEHKEDDNSLERQSILQAKFGKHGMLTRMLQPEIKGYHATAAPNRLVPIDEIHLNANKEDAKLILDAFFVDEKLQEAILSDFNHLGNYQISEGFAVRHPMIRISNIIYKKLIINIVSDEGYRFPWFSVNPMTHNLMDGDFDGDEVFFYRITNKDAMDEIKKHLHANNFLSDYKVGHYGSYHREWTNLEDYFKYLEEVKGKKLSKGLLHKKTLAEALLDSAPIHLTTMLSKELIGRSKGPIMKFESHITAYLFEHDLIDEYGRKFADAIQRLNETYTQPTISMQKWTDDLEDALRLHFKVSHLNKILSIAAEGLMYTTKGHFHVNKYFLDGKTEFKSQQEYAIQLTKANKDKYRIYNEIFKEFNYNLESFMEETEDGKYILTNKGITQTPEDPKAFIEGLIKYLNETLDTQINELANLEIIKDNFYNYYKAKGVDKK